MRRVVATCAVLMAVWPAALASAANDTSAEADPVWLRTVRVLVWPAVVVAAMVFTASPAGTRLLGPLLRRIRGVSVGTFKLDLTEEQAAKVRDNLKEVFSDYRKTVKSEFDRLARQHNVSFLRSQVINSAVIPHLSPGAQKDFRCTIHVQDLLFAEALYQLLDYAPGTARETRGRSFPVRFGILGRAWRSGKSLAQGNVSTDPSQLIIEWGMTSEEANAAGRGRQSFACAVLRDVDRSPLGVFYVDSMEQDAFGSTEPERAEFLKLIEDQAQALGLTGALAKLNEATRSRGPEIQIFDQA